MPRPFRKSYPKKKKPAYKKKRYAQKQAYRPRQKRRMKMMRQPFVETKKAVSMQADERVCNVLMTPTDQTAPQYRQWINQNISPTNNFLFMARGNTYSTFNGRDIYSKYLKQKIMIQLPSGIPPDTTNPGSTPNANRAFHRITQPMQFWVVWGWIKKPFGVQHDATGSPLDTDDVLNEIDNITETGDKLLGNLNTRGTRGSDFLTFKDKRKNIWTMQKKLLRIGHTPTSVKTPQANQYINSFHTNFSDPPGEPPDHGVGPRFNKADWGDFEANTGYPNVLQTSIEWKTNRKMRFYPDESGTGGFARDSWLPYSYICVPKQFQDGANRASPALYTYGETVDMKSYYDLVGEIKISTNMCHWFTDS
jgi:hypothetical protein